MNKVDLVNACVEKIANNGVKVTKKDMTVFVDTMFDVIKESLVEGNEVKISNFGSFSVVDKPAAEKRNPATGATVMVDAHRSPKFKYSGTVKELVR